MEQRWRNSLRGVPKVKKKRERERSKEFEKKKKTGNKEKNTEWKGRSRRGKTPRSRSLPDPKKTKKKQREYWASFVWAWSTTTSSICATQKCWQEQYKSLRLALRCWSCCFSHANVTPSSFIGIQGSYIGLFFFKVMLMLHRRSYARLFKYIIIGWSQLIINLSSCIWLVKNPSDLSQDLITEELQVHFLYMI